MIHIPNNGDTFRFFTSINCGFFLTLGELRKPAYLDSKPIIQHCFDRFLILLVNLMGLLKYHLWHMQLLELFQVFSILFNFPHPSYPLLFQIPIQLRHGYVSSLSYNHIEKRLYAWDKDHLVGYDVEFFNATARDTWMHIPEPGALNQIILPFLLYRVYFDESILFR